MYPKYIEINRQVYKINTDFRYALACFEAFEDNEINDIARAEAIITILLGNEDNEGKIKVPEFNEKDEIKVIKLLIRYLSCNYEAEEVHTEEKRDMDYIQDRKYINASFMSDYNINLDNTDMHWWKFCEFLSGLTDKCILNKIRDIRNTDLSEYKDEKTRAKLIEAMNAVKLKKNKSKEEKEAINEFNSLFE